METLRSCSDHFLAKKDPDRQDACPTYVLRLQPSPVFGLSNITATFSFRRFSSWQVCRRLSRAIRLAVIHKKQRPAGRLDSLRFCGRNAGGASLSESDTGTVS